MAIFWVLGWHLVEIVDKKLINGYISAPMQKLKKTKGSLLSETLKVKANVVSFSIFAQGLRYSLYLIFCQARQQGDILKFRKCLYLSLWSKIWKIKGTFFSQTLKVEGNKVSLVFSIFDEGLRYRLFLIFCHPRQQGAILEFRKWLYLSLWSKI